MNIWTNLAPTCPTPTPTYQGWMISKNVGPVAPSKINTTVDLSITMPSEKNVFWAQMTAFPCLMDYIVTEISSLVKEEAAIRVWWVLLESRVSEQTKIKIKHFFSMNYFTVLDHFRFYFYGLFSFYFYGLFSFYFYGLFSFFVLFAFPYFLVFTYPKMKQKM